MYYNRIFDDLCRNNFLRLGHVFQTEHEYYFYDSGTGKVFICELLEYNILQCLLQDSSMESLLQLPYKKSEIEKGLSTITELMMEEHILLRPINQQFIQQNLEETDYIDEIILELTEQCNFRCRYCVFNEYFNNFRSFHNRNMSWDIAKKAIDYAAKRNNNNLFIGFYGGEPLLNYPIMKRCIDYANQTYPDHRLFFSMTSNLSLVNQNIADDLSSLSGLSIMCSIDGPKEIHDTYRLNRKNEGSFDKTMQGLQLLVETLGTRAKGVLSVNAVVCPPYTHEKYNQIKTFFENHEIFPKGMKFQYNYVSYGGLKDSGLLPPKQSMDTYFQRPFSQVDPFTYISLQNLIHNSNIEFEKSTESIPIVKMHNRIISDTPLSIIPRNGCCRPGGHRLYVTVDGNLHLCEKVGEAPCIGHIDSGLQKDIIKKIYYTDYDEASLNKCNNCWAVLLCDLCYASCMNSKGIDMKKKNDMCYSIRAAAKHHLIEYHTLLEQRPELIKEILEEYQDI